MTIFQAVFLGLVQGVTEFLPISSSGHLTLLQQFFGLATESPVIFDIVVHSATLIAIIIFFLPRVFRLTRSDLLNLFIGTLPVVAAGLLLKPYVDAIFTNSLLTAFSLLVTSLLLFLASIPRKKTTTQITLPMALIIGLFQSLALLPGVSRSGSTISSAIILGVAPVTSFNFAFLLGIPSIFGAVVLLLKDLTVTTFNYQPLIAAFFAALVSGLLSLKLLSYLIKKHNLLPFAIYTFFLGLITLGLLL